MSEGPVIARLEALKLRLPLTVPYKLAFGPVTAFDTLLLRAFDADGREGWGEATLLTGYTEETAAGAWTKLRALAEAVRGRGLAEAIAWVLDRSAKSDPFAATAIVTALEMLKGSPWLDPGRGARVPLLAIVNATAPEDYGPEIEARIAEGYGTLKLKVGFDRAADSRRIADIQERVAGRAKLRIDGNQGYTRAEALAFLADLEPRDVELVEQPCAASDWEAAVALARAAPVAMMLDESIYGLEDINRAADLGAAGFVKLKLMKFGSLERLVEGLRRIGSKGMTPVLGNGVAADPGCWMEASVAAGLGIATAGEMNGFLKPREALFEAPLEVAGGALRLPVSQPRLDWQRIEGWIEARAVFRVAAA